MIRRREPVRLAASGVAVVGVTYGMARYGYGLLLPDIQHTYAFSAGTLGAIATGSYVAYLFATMLTSVFAARVGPRGTAVSAALIAAVGMTVAGLARSPGLFAIGVVAGGSGAGLAFPPFSDVAQRLPTTSRGRVLSAINCGTGYGVALAAPIAILTGSLWREAWLAFAAVALATAAFAWRALPARADAGREKVSWRVTLDPTIRLMLISGTLIGLGSSTFWTFAVEHLTNAGALAPASSRAFLGVVGLASVLATSTSDLIRRVGPTCGYLLLTVIEALAVTVVALGAHSAIAAFIAAILYGAAYNGVIAIQAIWSTTLFPERPSLGISLMTASNGAGLMLGPLLAGLLIGPIGLTTVLLIGAATIMLASACAPRANFLMEATT